MDGFISTSIMSIKSESARGKGDHFIPCGIQLWKIPNADGGFSSSDTVSFISTSAIFPNGITYRKIMQNPGSRYKVESNE